MRVTRDSSDARPEVAGEVDIIDGNFVFDRFAYPIRHGSMRIGVYAPRGRDEQAPHEQDELYIVASGSGSFVKDGERRPFAPGDAIFVEAHARHRFEDFSDDFSTWVIFWGPKGGE